MPLLLIKLFELIGTTLHRLFDTVNVLSVPRTKRIFVLGDSHAFALRGSRGVFCQHLGPITLNRFGRSGEASLVFKNSFRFVWPSRLQICYSRDNQPTLVLSFGEIDIRTHVFPQSHLQQLPPSDIVTKLVSSAINAIAELRRTTQCRIVFLSPTPPTDIVNNPNFPISGPLPLRIQWTKQFSVEMNEKLAESEFPNVSLLDTSNLFAASNGSLPFDNSDSNVHYSKRIGKLIIQQIQLL